MVESSAGSLEGKPIWSVVTVSYNSASDLREFGPASLNDSIEWIVVDNASTDDSVAVARDLGASVVPMRGNHGFATACNAGFHEATGDYVAFFNPDLAWDAKILEDLRVKLDRVGACLLGPQLLNSDGSLQPNGRGVPSLIRKIRNRTPWPSAGYRIECDGDEDRFVAWLMGAAVVGRRETLKAIGAWSEKYFVYYEDHDLGLKAWSEGVPCIITGGVRVRHGWARETASISRSAWINEITGAVKFYTSHPSLLFSSKARSYKYGNLHAFVGGLVRD